MSEQILYNNDGTCTIIQKNNIITIHCYGVDVPEFINIITNNLSLTPKHNFYASGLVKNIIDTTWLPASFQYYKNHFGCSAYIYEDSYNSFAYTSIINSNAWIYFGTIIFEV